MTKNSQRIQQQCIELQRLPEGFIQQIVDKEKQVQIIVKIPLKMITPLEQVSVGSVKHLQFLIYLSKQTYPFSPPLIFCLTNFSYPRLDDSRNLLEQIIGKDNWWPITMIKQIVLKIPESIKRLLQQMTQNQRFNSFESKVHRIGSYAYAFNQSIEQQFFRNKAKACIFYEGYFWKSDGYFIGSYKQVLIALGMSNIMIFERNAKKPTKIKLVKVIFRDSILKVSRKVVKRQVQVCFTLENSNKKVFIKFQVKKIQREQMNVTQRINNLDIMIRCNELNCLICRMSSGNDKNESDLDIKIVYLQLIEFLSHFQQTSLQLRCKQQLKQLYIKEDTVNSFYNQMKQH